MSAILKLLRPTERLQLAVEVAPVFDLHQNPNSTEEDDRRVLAIITHERDGKELGSVFLMKWRRTQSLVILSTMPINSGFDIHATQLTPDLRKVQSLSSEMSTKPNTQFHVTLGNGDKKIEVLCKDAKTLGEIISQTKRLKLIAGDYIEDPHSSWLSFYNPKSNNLRVPPQIFALQDLRTLHTGPTLSTAAAGTPGEEEADLLIIRDSWIRDQLKARASESSTASQISIRIGTFNVNGRLPSESLASWIGGWSEPDVLVLGFQELDLSTEALLYETTIKEGIWAEAILADLGESASQYTKLSSKQLAGILIIVLVRRALRAHISEVSTSAAGVGIMGTMGNKGATAVRFRYQDTVLTFVNAHLAAFDAMVDKRNSDYHELCKRLLFPVLAATPAAAAQQIQPLTASIFESDCLFWLRLTNFQGDLNYRIDLPDEEVRTLLSTSPAEQNFSLLFQYDQLQVSMRARKAFSFFEEARIFFPPTYRFQPGVLRETYDMKRRPAWTDRILYFASDKSGTKQLSYESHPAILLSDHNPVSADFDIQVNARDLSRYRDVARDILSTLDGFEHADEMPRVKISSNNVDLGAVRYMVSQHHHFEIHNISQIPCVFRFVPADDGSSICLPWLSLQPHCGLILPGQVARVDLTVHIDNPLAAALNVGPNVLEQTLIIHLARGLDYFVAVTGNFLPSCFARNLSSLVRLPGPARSSTGDAVLTNDKALNAPRELMRIIDWLMSNGLDAVDDLFTTPADKEIMAQIRECLDTGSEFAFPISDGPNPSQATLAIAFGAVLVQFLDSITESVIPPTLLPHCAETADREQAYELVGSLPNVSANVWISVTAFLNYLAMQSPTSEGSKATIIGAIFAPILLRDPSVGQNTSISPLAARRFLMYFIS